MKRILIIEDEPNLRDLYVLELEEEGYSCTAAGTGSEALDTLRKESFDLVMIDIKLPDITGIELIQQVKPLVGDTPVFIVTALSQLRNHFAFTDVTAFITKSSDLSELKSRIAEQFQPETAC